MLENEKEQIQKIYNFIRNYYFQNKKVPSINQIKKVIDLDRKTISSILQLLTQHKYLKYKNKRYWVPEQYLKRNTKKPETKESTEQNSEKELIVSEDTKEKIKNIENKMSVYLTKEIKTKKINKVFFFKILVGIILPFFIYLGIEANFTSFILIKNYHDALISSIGFFIFEVLAFDLYILFRIQKNKTLTKLFFILFLILFINNFINIFCGQFEKYQSQLFNKKNIITENTQELLTLYDKEEIDLQKKLNNQYDQIEIFKEKYEKNKNDKNAYWIYLNKSNNIIPEIEKKLKEIRIKKEFIFNSNSITKQKKETPYQFISKILFNLHPKIIQFLHLIFPTFILSLICSIGLSLIFFLKNKE